MQQELHQVQGQTALRARFTLLSLISGCGMGYGSEARRWRLVVWCLFCDSCFSVHLGGTFIGRRIFMVWIFMRVDRSLRLGIGESTFEVY